jgi:transcriptional regulator with XRE-family HTH domain
VPARKGDQTDVRTRLAALRVDRGLTQAQMARYTGLTVPTYRRLERGQIPAPSLAYLANCALVLDVALEALIEDEWREWHVFDARDAARPPRLSFGAEE